MRKSRRIIKNMLSLSIAEIANKGISLITMAYLARILLPDAFGVIGVATSFVLYFIFIVDLGFNVVGPREIAKSPNDLRKYVNNIISIKAILSVVLYIILAGIVYFLDKPLEVKYVILIFGFNIFANAFLLNWVFQGIEKMGIIAIRQVTTSLLNLIGVIIFVHSPADIILAISVIIGSMLINTTWMFIYYMKLFGRLRFSYDIEFWKKLLKSSIPIAITLFFTVVYNNTSIVLLSFMHTDYEAGIYLVSFKVLAFTLVPSGILQSVFIPQLARSSTIEERRRLTSKFALLSFLVAAIVSVGFFTFSDYIIHLGFGAEYSDSSLILKLLMITSLLSFISITYASPLLSWKYEKKILWAMAAGSIVNIVINLSLIPKYGAKGAAIASILTEATVIVGLAIIMHSVIKKLYFNKLLISLICAVISCFAGYYLMNLGIHPLISGTISIIIYAAINFFIKTITLNEIKMYLKKN